MMTSLHFVGVYSQTCYTECLKEATGDATIVNIMVVDAISDPFLLSYQGWLDVKIMEFNGHLRRADPREI